MSPANAVYLVGLLALLVGQRLLGGAPGAPMLVSVAGGLALLVALGLRVRGWRRAGSGAQAAGHRRACARAMWLTVGGVVAVGLYLLTTDAVVASLGLDERAVEGADAVSGVDVASRWRGVWGALWPALLGVCTLPLLALDRAMQRAGVRIPEGRVDQVVASALVVGLVAALTFPLNYLGVERNIDRDYGYFKTTEVGTATRGLVDSLEAPVDVRIWQAPTSDVTPELRGYFASIEGPKLRVEVIDHAAAPALARALQVPGNGWVTFTIGEPTLPGPGVEFDAAPPEQQAVSDKINVGPTLDEARRALRRLDESVQETLHTLGRGPRVAYLVQGHGELTYAGDPSDDRNVSALRAVLTFLGFRTRLVDEMGWLAKGVPDDATLVLVLGPDGPYFPEEGEALRDYLGRGGALLIALEPDIGRMRPGMTAGTEDALEGVLADLGLRLGPGVVASEVATQPLFRNKLDRTNILTNRYAVHPAVETLMQTKPSDPLLLLQSGWLEELETLPAGALRARRTALVKSLEVTWGDLDGRLDFDAATESRQAFALAYAVAGGVASSEDEQAAQDTDGRFRALVLADSGLLSDAALRSRANAQFAADAVLWLIGAESMAGSMESEEDVKIEHSKEGQAAWFYGTTLVVPLGLLGLGLLRLRRRRMGATVGGR